MTLKHVVISALSAAVMAAASAALAENAVYNIYEPNREGIAHGFGASLTRSQGSSLPLKDFTVAAQLTARNGANVHQWAFGVASEAWALQGSRSVLVGIETSVINEEPTNTYPKMASNAVFKNRADGADDPADPMNANSIAYWVTSQPGTGFERGVVFERGSLASTLTRPAAIDLSDLSDDEVGQIDLIRIRKDVALRYDPIGRQLVLVDIPSSQARFP